MEESFDSVPIPAYFVEKSFDSVPVLSGLDFRPNSGTYQIHANVFVVAPNTRKNSYVLMKYAQTTCARAKYAQ